LEAVSERVINGFDPHRGRGDRVSYMSVLEKLIFPIHRIFGFSWKGAALADLFAVNGC
jgi:hypothetical protein